MNDNYPVIKTVYKFVLAGQWVDDEHINRVKDINDIPREASHSACYSQETNTTILEIYLTPNFG